MNAEGMKELAEEHAETRDLFLSAWPVGKGLKRFCFVPCFDMILPRDVFLIAFALSQTRVRSIRLASVAPRNVGFGLANFGHACAVLFSRFSQLRVYAAQL